MALIETLVEKAQPFLEPIAGDNPAGNDPAYEPDFEKVKLELDKLTSMSGGTPAWDDMIALGDGLLKGKAKDFRLAVWLSVARMQTSGLNGLLEGFSLTHQLSGKFWDNMYPDAKRGRARANLAGWLNEQAAAWLLELTPTAGDREPLQALEELYKSLDGLLSEKLGDLYPGMGALRGALRDKIRQVPAEAPPPPVPEAVAPAAPAAAGAPAAAPSGFSAPAAPAVTSAEDAVAALRALGKSICEAAKFLRKADPAQAWPYRLQRTGAWLTVRAVPPVEGRATRIPPPPADQRKKLETQLAGEQWLELLNTAEDMTGTFLFWFDLHRMVALAMDRLGALFLPARESVGREIVGFVTRYPAIVGLTFADGTAFADAATQSWLDQERQKWGGGSPGGASRANPEDEELAERFKEAKELVGSGKIGEGLGLAIQLASRGADARTRFRARLNVAKLALTGGKPEVARPILEGLLQEADAHRLEVWEPELCASLFSALAACIKPPSKPGADGGSWAAVFDRLCRLDPAAALKLAGP
ncbi:MAG TPA: type VI secretion system protein TssA [Polyangiaceae bacterium]|jgi:type VI secretion system protein VasJ